MEDLLFDWLFDDVVIAPMDVNIDFDMDGIFDDQFGLADIDANFISDENPLFSDYDGDGLYDKFDMVNDLDHDFTLDQYDSFIDTNANFINDTSDPFQDWDQDGLFDGGYFQYRRTLISKFHALGEGVYE